MPIPLVLLPLRSCLERRILPLELSSKPLCQAQLQMLIHLAYSEAVRSLLLQMPIRLVLPPWSLLRPLPLEEERSMIPLESLALPRRLHPKQHQCNSQPCLLQKKIHGPPLDLAAKHPHPPLPQPLLPNSPPSLPTWH